MTTTRPDPLKDLLRRKTQQVAEQAATHDGNVPADQLDELSRLSRIIELREKSFPTQPRRWPLAAILGASLILVSLLLFVRVSTTDVELDLKASEVGLRLSRPQVLSQIVNLTELRASGLRDVQLSEAGLSRSALGNPDASAGTIRIAAMQTGQTAGTITLAPLNLPAAAEVRVFGMAPGNRARMVLNDAAGSLRVTVSGAVRADLSNAESLDLDSGMPRSLLLDTDSTEVNLELTSVAGSTPAFSPQLAIEKLTLSRVDEFQAPDGTTAQNVSTIQSGAIYLEALNGEKRELRPGELVQFRDIRGVLRVLKQEDDHVALQFRGTVRGMRTGWGENTTSLMPTYLAWLHARHGLSLLWGTTVYLFGLVMALLRWWRVSV